MPLPSTATPDSRALQRIAAQHTHRNPIMHLVHCDIPQEPLETAPRTALLADLIEGESWDGFWSCDAYYVRRTTDSGDVEWFEVVDDAAAPAAAEPRVLTLRAKTRPQSRVAVVVAKSPNGRRMLVGGSARRSAR